MISYQQNLEAEIIMYAINKSHSFFSFLETEIDVKEMKKYLEEKLKEIINFEQEFKDAISNLMSQGILVKDNPFYLGISYLSQIPLGLSHSFFGNTIDKIPEKLFLDKEKLKSKIAGGSLPQTVEKIYIDKKDETKKEIKEKLDQLNQKIKEKQSESDLHTFIKENKLIPAPLIKHEFSVLVQDRNDFLINNEFGEFEVWELKSPSVRLFNLDEDIMSKSERYNKLKSLSKTKEFVKAIEQLSIYKKEFIDHNKSHPQDHLDLKEHIYNAKLILVIGSSDELVSDIYLEKLNLERYMLNNLNIITWEMFYDKIKSYYGSLLND